jgi:hypothetical protein
MTDDLLRCKQALARASYLEAQRDTTEIAECNKWGRWWLIAVLWGAVAFCIMLMECSKWLA